MFHFFIKTFTMNPLYIDIFVKQKIPLHVPVNTTSMNTSTAYVMECSAYASYTYRIMLCNYITENVGLYTMQSRCDVDQ